jgi:hypothetical protein
MVSGGGVTKQVTLLLISAIGLGLLVVGVVKAVSTSGNTGGIVLVVTGALLLVSPFIIGRIERLSVTTSGLELQLSREISELGAPKTAQILERSDLAKFAESYAFIHEELRDSKYRNAKVHLQDLLVERAAAISRREKLNAIEVRTLFKNGSPMMRVLALGIMQGERNATRGYKNPLVSTEPSQETYDLAQRAIREIEVRGKTPIRDLEGGRINDYITLLEDLLRTSYRDAVGEDPARAADILAEMRSSELAD